MTSSKPKKMYNLRVLELFSGIGGMHSALVQSKISAVVVGAVDINNNANKVYSLNFPDTKLMQKNIEAITAEQIEKLKPDMILMSPPCQPFSRTGLQQGLADTRSMPLIHFMELLPKLWGLRYILLENVVGFGKSVARDELVQILEENSFEVQEFHLTPVQFHIPNSRPRYYLLAKRKPWKFTHKATNLAEELPVNLGFCSELDPRPFCKELSDLNEAHRTLAEGRGCYPLSHILEILEEGQEAAHAVPDQLLERYIWETDLVGPDSSHSCCFTKAYQRYFLGSGSVLIPKCPNEDWLKVFDRLEPKCRPSEEEVRQLRALGPRFFTPREICRLMCFPEHFRFPPEVTPRQASALLGNSVNVHVVALLIAYLTNGDLVLD